MGWAAALFIIVMVELASRPFFSLPPGTDIWSKADLATAGPPVPFAALLLVVLGWAGGAVAGGFLAGRLVPKVQMGHALAVALVVLVLAVWTMLTVPHPAWMWVASMLLIPAGGWLGGTLAIRAASADAAGPGTKGAPHGSA